MLCRRLSCMTSLEYSHLLPLLLVFNRCALINISGDTMEILIPFDTVDPGDQNVYEIGVGNVLAEV